MTTATEGLETQIREYLGNPDTLTHRTTSEIAIAVMPSAAGSDLEWARELATVRRVLRSMERWGEVRSARGTGKLAGQTVWQLTAITGGDDE